MSYLPSSWSGPRNPFFTVSSITSISVSPGRDQLVVFHSHHNNDLVIALQGEHQPLKEDRVGEIIAHVSKRHYELTQADLPVTVSPTFQLRLGNKMRTLSVEAVAGVDSPAFEHSGAVIVFKVPSSYASAI
ncbi:hypothetical protein pipiens_012266 [Culex pipiens pipiens]|uniref:TH1 domain-containing protein n=1 Tax=Culex pipiens pipiens TaxID=38569 RepID=A0ABD1D335_CULPP